MLVTPEIDRQNIFNPVAHNAGNGICQLGSRRVFEVKHHGFYLEIQACLLCKIPGLHEADIILFLIFLIPQAILLADSFYGGDDRNICDENFYEFIVDTFPAYNIFTGFYWNFLKHLAKITSPYCKVDLTLRYVNGALFYLFDHAVRSDIIITHPDGSG